MGLDWSTFLLELINFLILLWILKRFLYGPIRSAIEARRERVEAVLAEASARRAEAEQIRQDYESRKEGWERERAQALAALDQELAAQRARRLDGLNAEVQGRLEKAATLEARRLHETERRTQEAALALAADFGSRLLSRLADPGLEARLVEMLIEDLPRLSQGHRETLAQTRGGEPPRVRIQSAYPLSEEQHAALIVALGQAAGRPDLRYEFHQEPGLIAGLRIDAGPLVMRANLRDELRFFTESAFTPSTSLLAQTAPG